jgi:hypothetical protein
VATTRAAKRQVSRIRTIVREFVSKIGFSVISASEFGAQSADRPNFLSKHAGIAEV